MYFISDIDSNMINLADKDIIKIGGSADINVAVCAVGPDARRYVLHEGTKEDCSIFITALMRLIHVGVPWGALENAIAEERQRRLDIADKTDIDKDNENML